MKHARRSGAGFTLIELVAVLAIFALVALMALQALTGAIYQSRVLERADQTSEELTRALTLLRRDFGAALPATFHPPLSDPEPALLAPVGAGRIALSITGHPRLPGDEGAGMARVVWRHDPVASTLTRRVWPVLHPARGTLLGPERVILSGVTGLSVAPLGDWPEREEDAASLPEGFDIWINSARHGALRVVVAR